MANPLDHEDEQNTCTYLIILPILPNFTHLIVQFGNPLAGSEEDLDPGKLIYLIPHIAR